MPFSSLVEPNSSNNNDRLRKALAQRSTPSKPSLPQLATNLTESSISISESPFDDVFIDPRHVSVTNFSTYASSTSSSSNESTDSMLVSSLASPSNTTCSTSFMTSSTSVSPPPAFLAAPQDPASKPSPDSLSFLDSSVPPISSTPTQFNIQRMKMADNINTNNNNNNAQACAVAKSSASTLSNDTVNSTARLSRQNTHLHTTPPTTYSTQFNKINGANLLGQNHSMEYGKFGKIVAGSVHSFSSFDSTDSFGRRSGSSGPRRLFEKSKGTLVIKEERAPRSYSSNLNLENNSMHFNSPGSCFSRNTSVSNFASAKSSIHTINRPNDELYDAFHHNHHHHHHNHLYADPVNRSANAKSLFSDPRVADSADNNSTHHSDFLLPHQSSNLSLNSDVSGLARTNTLLSNKSSFSADPNDPTDLSAAFMNLHTSSTSSAGTPSGKKSRRSSFHVISSSDFAHCAEEEEFSDNESITGAGNHVAKPAFPISPKVFRKPSIQSVHSSGHLDLNLDLDKVIHNALVESAHINTPTNMSCHSAFHHEDYYQYPTHPVSTNHSDNNNNNNNNNNNTNNITTTTTRRSSLAHDTFSRPMSTNLHYDSEMLQATHTTDEHGTHLHSIHSGTAQEDLPPAEPHPRHTTFGKFGTSVKKLARKMASSHAEH